MSMSGVKAVRTHRRLRTPRTPLKDRELRLTKGKGMVRASRQLESNTPRQQILGPIVVTAPSNVPGPGAYNVRQWLARDTSFCDVQFTSSFAPVSSSGTSSDNDSGPGPANVGPDFDRALRLNNGCLFGLNAASDDSELVPGPGAYPVDRGIANNQQVTWLPAHVSKHPSQAVERSPGPGSYNPDCSPFAIPGNQPKGFTIGERPVYAPRHESGEWLRTPAPGTYTKPSLCMGGMADTPDTQGPQIVPPHRPERPKISPGPSDYHPRTPGDSASASYTMRPKPPPTKQENWTRPCAETPGPGEYPVSLALSDRSPALHATPRRQEDARDSHIGQAGGPEGRGEGPGPGAYIGHGSIGRPATPRSKRFTKIGLKHSWPHQDTKGDNGVPGPGQYEVKLSQQPTTPFRKLRKYIQAGCEPLDDEMAAPAPSTPGPGKYSHQRILGPHSNVHSNSPRFKFGQSERELHSVEKKTPGPGAYSVSCNMLDKTSHRRPQLAVWSAPSSKGLRSKDQGMELLPPPLVSGLVHSPGMPLLPVGNLPALLQIASQNPALAEAFQERCESLAAANPALIPFIEELHASAGLGLVRTASSQSPTESP